MDRRIDRRGCEVGEERCNVCSGAARGEKRRRIVNDMAMGSGSIDEVEDIKECEVVEGQEGEAEEREEDCGSHYRSGSGSGFGVVGPGSGFKVVGPGSRFEGYEREEGRRIAEKVWWKGDCGRFRVEDEGMEGKMHDL